MDLFAVFWSFFRKKQIFLHSLRIYDIIKLIFMWGISSAGRALAWHARGHQFKSGILHFFIAPTVLAAV